MNKKRLTLLLDDAQIRIIKSRAALAGLTGSQWVIEQLDLEADALAESLMPDADEVSGAFLTAFGDPGPVTDDTPHVDADPVPEPATAAQAVEPSSAADSLVPDCTGKKITKDERDKILLALDATDMSPQEKVDLLLKNSIPSDARQSTYKVDWNTKKLKDLVYVIRKRAK